MTAAQLVKSATKKYAELGNGGGGALKAPAAPTQSLAKPAAPLAGGTGGGGGMSLAKPAGGLGSPGAISGGLNKPTPLPVSTPPAAPQATNSQWPSWAKPEFQNDKHKYMPWETPGLEGGRIVNMETGVIAQAETPNREAWFKQMMAGGNQAAQGTPAPAAPAAAAAAPATAPVAPPPQAGMTTPSTPMVSPTGQQNLTLGQPQQPAVPPPPGQQNQPQPIVSNAQGTMTDTSGQPVATSEPQPTGPEAFVAKLKERSGGKEPTGGVIDMTKPLDVNAMKEHFGPNSKLNPEQQQQLAGDLATKLKTENPQYYEGFQDIQAGKSDTPAAKAYQGRLQQAEQEFAQQQLAANPNATTQEKGGILQNAISQFQNMPLPLQAMVGIGLPVGLIGIMSSMFGGGGMGMGVLGALGLGAGVLGGAAGGMFGQETQNMVTDGLFNAGQFLGMVPEGKQDLSMLTAKDPIAAIKAKGGSLHPDEVKKQLAHAEQQKKQLGTLMSLPEGMRARMLQRLDPSITDEQAGLAASNAAMLHKHLNDPNSELSQLQQQGRDWSDGGKTWTGVAGAVRGIAGDAAQGAYDYTLGNSYMPWNWGGEEKTSMFKSAIEKWAFNDMDAKELSDLKAEKAKGAPYRVDNARREHELNLRNQAKPAAKKTIVVMCMKSARCWAGYEAVPGKKPYSEDSCRPIGSKKKAPKKKAAK